MKQKYRIRPDDIWRFKLQKRINFLWIFPVWIDAQFSDSYDWLKNNVEICKGEIVE